MSTVTAAVLDACVVLAAALLACRALARRPAALRHAVLAAALIAAAAAPALEAVLPRWELPLLASSQVASSGLTPGSQAPETASGMVVASSNAPRFTWTAALVGLWGIGCALVLAGLAAGIARLAWVTRRCLPIESGAWREQLAALSSEHAFTRPVALLQSRDHAPLLTWGAFRPAIIVPAGALPWGADRIRIVLAHELAHIHRLDWPLQMGAELLRAVYWFNPLVWIACRRLRDESEQACDDAVLRGGAAAADYASHLLAIARHTLAGDRRWAHAPAVVNPSTLERRIAAMLNASRSHAALARGAGALALAATLAVAAPMASLTLTARDEPTGVAAAGVDIALAPSPIVEPAPVPRRAARAVVPSAAPTATAAADVAAVDPVVAATATAEQQAPASVSGVARDPSGAVLPGVTLTLTDFTGKVYTRTTDGAGSFSYPDLPPGQYALVAQLPGFTSLKVEFSLAAGQNLERRLDLRVGSFQETIIVVCAPGAALLPAASRGVLAFSRRENQTGFDFTKIENSRPGLISPVFAAQATPVRVGGQIQAPRQVNAVSPICPPTTVPPTGAVVILEAVVGPDGSVSDMKALRDPGAEFVESAQQAVRQWRYTPTRLNNVPVPVTITVTVMYRR